MIGSPERDKNSKNFTAKFKQNPTTPKNHKGFLKILGVKIPPGGHNNFWGSK